MNDSRVCACGCGRSLRGRHSTAKYATKACGGRARRDRDRRVRDLVVAFFADPPPNWRRCIGCGQLLRGQRKDAKFCTPACRVAYRRAGSPPPAAGPRPLDPPLDAEPLHRTPVAETVPSADSPGPPDPPPDKSARRERPEPEKSGYRQPRANPRNRGESRTKREQAAKRPRLLDLHWVVKRYEGDEYPACTYCGMPADTQDHVLPRAYIGALAQVDPDLVRFMMVVVPACRDCNSSLGAHVFATLRDKGAWLHRRLERRYARLLATPDWGTDELAELGPTLRAYVSHDLTLRELVEARLRWSRKFVKS